MTELVEQGQCFVVLEQRGNIRGWLGEVSDDRRNRLAVGPIIEELAVDERKGCGVTELAFARKQIR